MQEFCRYPDLLRHCSNFTKHFARPFLAGCIKAISLFRRRNPSRSVSAPVVDRKRFRYGDDGRFTVQGLCQIPCLTPFPATSDPSVLKRILAYLRGTVSSDMCDLLCTAGTGPTIRCGEAVCTPLRSGSGIPRRLRIPGCLRNAPLFSLAPPVCAVSDAAADACLRSACLRSMAREGITRRGAWPGPSAQPLRVRCGL
jgi:hypothetical protein